MKHYQSILVISDTQIPFEHKSFLPFCLALKEKYSPELVIHVGDEVDFHALSTKWPSDPDGFSPGHELEQAIIKLHAWYDAFPKVHVCISNHTWRPYRKAKEMGMPNRFLKSIGAILEAPKNWKWKDYWEFNGILFEHGEGVSGPNAALNAAKRNRQSTVIGHQHTHAGVVWSRSRKDAIFGMNVGCGIDITQYAFAYTRKSKEKPQLGCGIILNGLPYFVPMFLDRSGKWDGNLPSL